MRNSWNVGFSLRYTLHRLYFRVHRPWKYSNAEKCTYANRGRILQMIVKLFSLFHFYIGQHLGSNILSWIEYNIVEAIIYSGLDDAKVSHSKDILVERSLVKYTYKSTRMPKWIFLSFSSLEVYST